MELTEEENSVLGAGLCERFLVQGWGWSGDR